MHEEQEVTQTTPETDSAAEFEELIQGRCKQPFQQRVQKIRDGRLRSLRQQLLQLAQVVDEAKGTHLAESLSAEQGGGQNAAASAGKAVQESHSAMERSRQQSREVVRPR